MAEETTLDTLLSMYGAAPANYRPNIYVYHALGDDGKTTGGTLGPIPLPSPPLDESMVWRGVAARLGGPGRVVLRLQLAGGGLAESTGLQLTDALWKVWGPTAYAAPAAAPPPPPAYAPPPSPAPPADLLTVMLQGMQQTQQLLISLITKPQENPAIPVMQAEIQRLQAQLAEPYKRDKESTKELIDLAVAASKGESTGGAAAMTLLAGPIDKLAAAMAKAVEVRSEVELRKAETLQLEAATRATAAGVPTEAATPDATQTSQAPATA